MRVVPETTVGMIEFYQTHQQKWIDNALSIGLTHDEAVAMADLTAQARAAYREQQAAQLAARSATLRLHLAMEAMADTGSSLILKIRAQAAIGGEGIYTLASLPVPARASKLAAPGMPTSFKATLLSDGTLKLTWKCRNPAGSQGTTYRIARALGTAGDGVFVPLGFSGVRSFVDETVPAGAASFTYEIVAARSTATGPIARFTVNLGVSGAAGATLGVAA